MSEKVSHSHEHHTSPETVEASHERSEAKHEHEKPAERLEKAQETSIESIRDTIKHEALKAADEVPHPIRQEPHDSPTSIGKDLKDQALYRTLKNLRHHLSPADRSLSRIVHQPVVDAASELGSKTVARPSGILSGGICAFVGSLTFLYLAKHDGYRYNYLLFFIFFVGGFAIGLVIELLLSLIRRMKNAA